MVLDRFDSRDTPIFVVFRANCLFLHCLVPRPADVVECQCNKQHCACVSTCHVYDRLRGMLLFISGN
jgi:hypothetical protein